MVDSPTTESPVLVSPELPQSPPALSSEKALEKLKANSTSACVIPLLKLFYPYKGKLLAKDNGTYTTWAQDFKHELVLNGLSKYVFKPPPIPNKYYQPRVHEHYLANDELTCSFIATAVASEEHQFIEGPGT
ncbi:hypothetical protein DXG01_005263 [Tephrocybe rancida]|nr:hypothetical protein DXG01_005263 [Tephrocybe rancida]